MWVLVRKTNGSETEIDMPEDSYPEVGDILDDGSVVLEIRFNDEDPEEELIELGYYPEDRDEDLL